METMTETKVCAVFASDPGGLAPKPATAIVQAVAAIASSDMARGVITGVHVQSVENGGAHDLVLSATDSYRLIQVTLPNMAVSAFDPFTVPAKELVQACKIAKGSDRMAWRFDSAAVLTVVGFSNMVSESTAAVPVFSERYHDPARIIASVSDWCKDSETAVFDASLLAGLLDSCGVIAVGGRSGKSAGLPGVTVNRVNTLKPARFSMIDEQTGIQGIALLMPRRS